jgi:hypothetical protein
MNRAKTPLKVPQFQEQQSSSAVSGGFYPEDLGGNLKDKINNFVSETKSRSNQIQSTNYRMNAKPKLK